MVGVVREEQRVVKVWSGRHNHTQCVYVVVVVVVAVIIRGSRSSSSSIIITRNAYITSILPLLCRP